MEPSASDHPDADRRFSLVLMTENWSQQNKTVVIDTVRSLVDSGSVVAVFDDDVDWDSYGSIVRLKDADITCVFELDSKHLYYNIGCGSMDTVIQKMMEWMETTVCDPDTWDGVFGI